MGLDHVLGRADVSLAAYVVLVVLGVLHCFAGYRLFRALLGIWGFLVGFALVWAELQTLGIDPVLRVAGAALGGVVGVLLVSVVYAVGLFLFGAGCGVLVSVVLHQYLPAFTLLPLVLVLGVLGGVAALILQRPLITLLTAFGGAWIVVACGAAPAIGCPLQSFPAGCLRSMPWTVAVLGAWLLLGFFGYATQARLARGRPRGRDEEGD